MLPLYPRSTRSCSSPEAVEEGLASLGFTLGACRHPQSFKNGSFKRFPGVRAASLNFGSCFWHNFLGRGDVRLCKPRFAHVKLKSNTSKTLSSAPSGDHLVRHLMKEYQMERQKIVGRIQIKTVNKRRTWCLINRVLMCLFLDLDRNIWWIYWKTD